MEMEGVGVRIPRIKGHNSSNKGLKSSQESIFSNKSSNRDCKTSQSLQVRTCTNTRIGALDSQSRDVPRYTEIISKFPTVGALDSQAGMPRDTPEILSKFPAVVKAGHSAYPD